MRCDEMPPRLSNCSALAHSTPLTGEKPRALDAVVHHTRIATPSPLQVPVEAFLAPAACDARWWPFYDSAQSKKGETNHGPRMSRGVQSWTASCVCLARCALSEAWKTETNRRLSHVQFRRPRSYNDCSGGQSRLPSLIRATALDFSSSRALGAGVWFSHKADVVQDGLSAQSRRLKQPRRASLGSFSPHTHPHSPHVRARGSLPSPDGPPGARANRYGMAHSKAVPPRRCWWASATHVGRAWAVLSVCLSPHPRRLRLSSQIPRCRGIDACFPKIKAARSPRRSSGTDSGRCGAKTIQKKRTEPLPPLSHIACL